MLRTASRQIYRCCWSLRSEHLFESAPSLLPIAFSRYLSRQARDPNIIKPQASSSQLEEEDDQEKPLPLFLAYEGLENIRTLNVENKHVLGLLQERVRPEILNEYITLQKHIEELNQMRKSSDQEIRELADIEMSEVYERLTKVHLIVMDQLTFDKEELFNQLYLEINPGVGGQESMLFGAELLEVYLRFIVNLGWRYNILEKIESDIGGVRSASVEVSGQQCYKYLRHESGVHRVQRVPKTEKSGRIHTSTVKVAVIPFGNEDSSLVEIDERKDLKFEFKRASGPGGQNVNKSMSCARVTHLPTGNVVECQEERSQEQNKRRAIEKLQTLLMKRALDDRARELEETRAAQVGSGGRSEKIRTYNFPQNRISDHRISQNMHDLTAFMEGDSQKLQELIGLLEMKHREAMLNKILHDLDVRILNKKSP